MTATAEFIEFRSNLGQTLILMGLERYRTQRPKDSVAALEQFLYIILFQRFLLIPVEFRDETGAVGKVILLVFQRYLECSKRSSYETGASVLVQAALGARAKLEPELFGSPPGSNVRF